MSKKGGNSDGVRYPQRNKKPIDYKETDEPADDRWIYCDGCRTDVVDWCRRCGRMARLRDRAGAPAGGPHAPDGRARLTLPGCLRLRPSPLHGLGVFAAAPLPRGVLMGPYQGRLLPPHGDPDSRSPGGYAWKLRDGRLVDAGDERHANWMRFVNCAPHASHQNLVGFQYRGSLYYRTVLAVPVGGELLVYYGDTYARAIGIDVDNYYRHGAEPRPATVKETEALPPAEAEDGVVEEGEEASSGSGEGPRRYYTCRHCGIGLYNEEFKIKHEFRCLIRRRELESRLSELFACKHCRGMFIEKEFWEKHEAKWCKSRPVVNKNKSDERFECDECGSTFTQKCSLKRHLRLHDKENQRWFMCDSCPYKTIVKTHMTRHKRLHSDTYICACPFCNKSFRRKLYLDDHLLRRHSNEDVSKLISRKIYSCNICGKYKTVQKSHFTDHLQVVHLKGGGRESYRCHHCKYSTFRKRNFKRHLKIHSGEKPYMCTACKKVFIQKKELDGHILSKHGQNSNLTKTITSKMHYCQRCSYKTVYLGVLKSHNKSNHTNS